MIRHGRIRYMDKEEDGMISEKQIHRPLRSLLVFLSLATVVCVLGTAAEAAQPNCYVAGKDRRVYTLDIEKWQVAAISDPIPELGRPTCMDISRDGKTLYIGSEPGHYQMDYFPIVALDVRTMKVKSKFRLEPYPDTGYISAVYTIRTSHNGKTLFASYANPKYIGGSVVVDAETGAILRHLSFYVSQNSALSDDGEYVSRIRKDRVRTYSLQNNQELPSVSVEELFSSGRGLNPPWANLKTPLCVIDRDRTSEGHIRHVFRVVDRSNGDILHEKSVYEQTGLSARYPLAISHSGRNMVLLPTVGQGGASGYVISFDLDKARFGVPINVGAYPTNVVCSYE